MMLKAPIFGAFLMLGKEVGVRFSKKNDDIYHCEQQSQV